MYSRHGADETEEGREIPESFHQYFNPGTSLSKCWCKIACANPLRRSTYNNNASRHKPQNR